MSRKDARGILSTPRRPIPTEQTHTRAGDIANKTQPRFSRAASMPAICEALRKAAYDPRVSGLLLNIDVLSIGWAKVLAGRDAALMCSMSWRRCLADPAHCSLPS
jgi:hypothetical protein